MKRLYLNVLKFKSVMHSVPYKDNPDNVALYILPVLKIMLTQTNITIFCMKRNITVLSQPNPTTTSHWSRACTATTSWKLLPLFLLEDCLRCFNCLLETGDCTLLTCCVRKKFGHKMEKTKVARKLFLKFVTKFCFKLVFGKIGHKMEKFGFNQQNPT